MVIVPPSHVWWHNFEAIHDFQTGEVSEANYLHTKKEISGELQGRCQAI
jgi:hypothetical protein